LDYTSKTVTVVVDHALSAEKPQLYGFIFGDPDVRVRVFPGPQNHPDPKFVELIGVGTPLLAKASLRLQVRIYGPRENDLRASYSGSALPFLQQHENDQKVIEQLLAQHAQQKALTEQRSPADVFQQQDLPPAEAPQQAKDQAAIIDRLFDFGENPGLMLTKTEARLRLKTDRDLIVVLQVAAHKLGVKVPDLCNEIMWEAVRSGRIWDCQTDNGMP
tara:strand:- start:932 stop:1582 length:651 start_codon:yes stop_codon:yes gene_type:complete